MRSRASAGAAALLLVLMGLLGSTSLALAQEEGVSISGRVVNRTPQGAVPAGVEVLLRGGQGTETVWQSTTLTDEEGRFRFEGVPANAEYAYAFDVEYQGAFYREVSVNGPPADPVEVTVYSSTTSAAQVGVLENALLIQRVVEGGGELVALESVTVENAGTRTLVTDFSQGVAGMDFLRFSLSPGFSNLQVNTTLLGGQVVEVGTGFALITPVPPGQHQVLFTYRFPYEGGAAELNRSFPFGANTFRVLLNEGVGRVVAPGFSDMDSVTIGERRYQVVQASSLEPGARAVFRLEGLAQPSLGTRVAGVGASTVMLVALPAVAGGALLGLLAFVLVRRRRQALRQAGAVAEQPVPQDRASLVEAIARLDIRFERGEVQADHYRRYRAALKARLREVTLKEQGPAQAPQPNPGGPPRGDA